MRIGTNPAKQANQLSSDAYHRIIIPVYIPELSGYFAQSLNVLQLCLASLYASTHNKTAITLIDNASCPEVKDYIQQEFTQGRIDQLISNSINRGKVDPLMSAIRGSYEPLITITDADVLFKPGWQQIGEQKHAAIKNLGMLSYFPTHGIPTEVAFSTLRKCIIPRKMKFAKFTGNPKELLHFYKSIGREITPDFQTLINQKLTATINNEQVVVGGGHFVATYKRYALLNAPLEPSLKKIVGGSETTYLDIPNDKYGYYRGATPEVLVFHMGNQSEPWMDEALKKYKTQPKPKSMVNTSSFLFRKKKPIRGYHFRKRLFIALYKRTPIGKLLLNWLQCPKEIIPQLR